MSVFIYNVIYGGKMKKLFKIVIQIAIIYAIYQAGNLISSLISNIIVIPGNIIGMVILLLLLTTNVLKFSIIEETSNFMLKYMSFFFVPLSVGIMESYKLIQGSIVQIIIYFNYILHTCNVCIL